MLNFFKNLIKINKEMVIIVFIFIPSLVVCIKTSFLFIIITSMILAYFLYKVEKIFIMAGFSVNMAFLLTYFCFITFFVLMFLILIPLIFKQLFIFLNDLPFIIQKIKIITYKLIKAYPVFFPKEQTNIVFSNIIGQMQSVGKIVVSVSLLSIIIIIKWLVYGFFIPILMFFFLKDHVLIMNTFKIVMPEKSEFCVNIWKDIHKQIDNYIRGKIFELVIVMLINVILFKYYKLAYANLLAFIVGVSVIIPYIGAIIVSIPIFLISAIQLGVSIDFCYLLIFYMIIQFLDGILLVPILFSEAVKLHPITIIMSIIILGSLCNLYGLFFAIPIALVIKSIIKLYLFPNIHTDNRIN